MCSPPLFLHGSGVVGLRVGILQDGKEGAYIKVVDGRPREAHRFAHGVYCCNPSPSVRKTSDNLFAFVSSAATSLRLLRFIVSRFLRTLLIP